MNLLRYCFGFLLFMYCCIDESTCQWGFTQEQAEIYDLVDETKQNFYEFMGITQEATSAEVRRAYRKLSLSMHPDRNKTEGAEENFRILAAMYEVLKSKDKREIYDEVLANGLPAAYLYVPKQLRKMSLMEVSVIISVIVTLGHFLFMWGSYVEKRLALDDMLPRIQKRLKKQKKKKLEEVAIEDVDEALLVPKPTIYDVLPILLARRFYAFVFWVPEFVRHQREQKKLLQEQEAAELKEAQEADMKYQEEVARRNEAKKLKQERNRQRKEEMLKAQEMTAASGPLPPSVFEDGQSIEELEAMYDDMDDEDFKKKKSKKNDWTDEDQSQLVKLMTKYPGGTSERWAKIAREMGRSMNEVTSKAKAAMSDVGSKAKYSSVTQLNNKLVTKNRKAGSQQIPDGVITTQGHPIDTEIQQMQGDVSSPISNSKVKRKQEVKELKQAIHDSLSETNNSNRLRNEDTSDNNQDKWEQSQQKLLEVALSQFPKSTTERWEKIASCVPGKTKEECIARYKFLAEKIQQRKKLKS